MDWGRLRYRPTKPRSPSRLIGRAIAIRGEWPERVATTSGVALQGAASNTMRGNRRVSSGGRALNSALFDAFYNLAVCLQLTGQRTKAIDAYRAGHRPARRK